MTREEYQELAKIRLRMGVMLGQTKVNYQRSADVFTWGMRDGMQLAFDMLDAWYHKLEKAGKFAEFEGLPIGDQLTETPGGSSV